MQPYNFQQQVSEGYQFVRPPAPSPPVVFAPYNTNTNAPPYNRNLTFIPHYQSVPMLSSHPQYHGVPLQHYQFPYVPLPPDGAGLQYIPNDVHQQQQFQLQPNPRTLSPLTQELPDPRSSPIRQYFTSPISQLSSLKPQSNPVLKNTLLNPQKELYKCPGTTESEVHGKEQPLLSNVERCPLVSSTGGTYALKQDLHTNSEQSEDVQFRSSLSSDGFEKTVSEHALRELLITSSTSSTQKTDKESPVQYLSHCDSVDSSEDFEFQLANLLQQIPMLPDSPYDWTPESLTDSCDDAESPSYNHFSPPATDICESESVDCELSKEFKDRAAIHGISIKSPSDSQHRKDLMTDNRNKDISTYNEIDSTQKSAEFNAEIFLEKAINCGITVGEKVDNEMCGASTDSNLDAYVEKIVVEVIHNAALLVINDDLPAPGLSPVTGEKVLKPSLLNPEIPAFKPSFSAASESVHLAEKSDHEESLCLPDLHSSKTSPCSTLGYNTEAKPFDFSKISPRSTHKYNPEVTTFDFRKFSSHSTHKYDPEETPFDSSKTSPRSTHKYDPEETPFDSSKTSPCSTHKYDPEATPFDSSKTSPCSTHKYDPEATPFDSSKTSPCSTHKYDTEAIPFDSSKMSPRSAHKYDPEATTFDSSKTSPRSAHKYDPEATTFDSSKTSPCSAHKYDPEVTPFDFSKPHTTHKYDPEATPFDSSKTSPRSTHRYNPEATPFVFKPASTFLIDKQGTGSSFTSSSSTNLPESELNMNVSCAVVETVDAGVNTNVVTRDRCMQTPLAFSARDVSINTDECCLNEKSKYFVPVVLTASCGMMTSPADVCSQHVQADFQACLTCGETSQRLLDAEVMVVRLRSQCCLMELERRLHELTYSQVQLTHVFSPWNLDESNMKLLLTNQIHSLKEEILRIKDLEGACVEALQSGFPMKCLPKFTVEISSTSDPTHHKPKEVDEITLNNIPNKPHLKPLSQSRQKMWATWLASALPSDTSTSSGDVSELNTNQCVETDKAQCAKEISFADSNFKHEKEMHVLNESFEYLLTSGQNDRCVGSEDVIRSSFSDSCKQNVTVDKTSPKRREQIDAERVKEILEIQTYCDADTEPSNILSAQKNEPLQEQSCRRKSEESISLVTNQYLGGVKDESKTILKSAASEHLTPQSNLKSVVKNNSGSMAVSSLSGLAEHDNVNEFLRKQAFAAVTTTSFSYSDPDDVSGLELFDDLDAEDEAYVEKQRKKDGMGIKEGYSSSFPLSEQTDFQKTPSKKEYYKNVTTVSSSTRDGILPERLNGEHADAILPPGLTIPQELCSATDVGISVDVDTDQLVKQAQALLNKYTTNNKRTHTDKVKFWPKDLASDANVVKRDLATSDCEDDSMKKKICHGKHNMSSDDIKEEFPSANVSEVNKETQSDKEVQSNQLATKFKSSEAKSSGANLSGKFPSNVCSGGEASRSTSNEVMSSGKDTEKATAVLINNDVAKLQEVPITQFIVTPAKVALPTVSGPVPVSSAKENSVTSDTCPDHLHRAMPTTPLLLSSVTLAPVTSDSYKKDDSASISATASLELSASAEDPSVELPPLLSTAFIPCPSLVSQTSAIDHLSIGKSPTSQTSTTGISTVSQTIAIDTMTSGISTDSQTSAIDTKTSGISTDSQTSAVDTKTSGISTDSQTSAIDTKTSGISTDSQTSASAIDTKTSEISTDSQTIAIDTKTSEISTDSQTSAVDTKTSGMSANSQTNAIDTKTSGISTDSQTSAVDTKTSGISTDSQTSAIDTKTSGISTDSQTSASAIDTKTSEISTDSQTIAIDTKTSEISTDSQTSAVDTKTSGMSANSQTNAIDTKTSGISTDSQTSAVDAKTSGILTCSQTSVIDPSSVGMCSNPQTSAIDPWSSSVSSNSQTKSMNPLVTSNSLISAVDPVLYQAVMVQLTKAYPQMFANPQLLQAVCLQQTMVLQNYVQNNNQAATSDNGAAHLPRSDELESQTAPNDISAETFNTCDAEVKQVDTVVQSKVNSVTHADEINMSATVQYDNVDKGNVNKTCMSNFECSNTSLSGNKSDIDRVVTAVTKSECVKDACVKDVTKRDVEGANVTNNKKLTCVAKHDNGRKTGVQTNLKVLSEMTVANEADDCLSNSHKVSKAAALLKDPTKDFQTSFSSLLPLKKPDSVKDNEDSAQPCSKISTDLTPTWFDTIQPLRRPGNPTKPSLKTAEASETALPESLQQYALHKRKRSGHEAGEPGSKPSFSAVLNTSETVVAKTAPAAVFSGKFTKLCKTNSTGKTSSVKSGLKSAAEDWDSGPAKTTEEDWGSECDQYPSEFRCFYNPKRAVDLSKSHPKPLQPLPGFSKKKPPTKVTSSHEYSSVACVNFSTNASREMLVAGIDTFTAKESCGKTNKQFLSKLLQANNQSNDKKGKQQKKQKLHSQPVETKTELNSVEESKAIDVLEPIADSRDENWQKVEKKKKRDQKEQTKTTPSVKADLKKSNYEKLILLLLSKFPQLDRSDATDVILKIRSERGVLSGLTVNTIIEMTTRIISTKQLLQPENLSKKSAFLTGKSADEEGDLCPICCDELVTAEVNKLDCGHEFHVTCIRRWLLGTERTCPTCRRIALLPEEFPRLGK